MKTNATAYVTGEEVPDRFAHKIELLYPDAGLVTLIYSTQPSDEELQEVMWFLQTRAAVIGYKILVTISTGETQEAAPISL